MDRNHPVENALRQDGFIFHLIFPGAIAMWHKFFAIFFFATISILINGKGSVFCAEVDINIKNAKRIDILFASIRPFSDYTQQEYDKEKACGMLLAALENTADYSPIERYRIYNKLGALNAVHAPVEFEDPQKADEYRRMALSCLTDELNITIVGDHINSVSAATNDDERILAWARVGAYLASLVTERKEVLRGRFIGNNFDGKSTDQEFEYFIKFLNDQLYMTSDNIKASISNAERKDYWINRLRAIFPIGVSAQNLWIQSRGDPPQLGEIGTVLPAVKMNNNVDSIPEQGFPENKSPEESLPAIGNAEIKESRGELDLSALDKEMKKQDGGAIALAWLDMQREKWEKSDRAQQFADREKALKKDPEAVAMAGRYKTIFTFTEREWPKLRDTKEGRKKALRWFIENRKIWEGTRVQSEAERWVRVLQEEN